MQAAELLSHPPFLVGLALLAGAMLFALQQRGKRSAPKLLDSVLMGAAQWQYFGNEAVWSRGKVETHVCKLYEFRGGLVFAFRSADLSTLILSFNDGGKNSHALVSASDTGDVFATADRLSPLVKAWFLHSNVTVHECESLDELLARHKQHPHSQSAMPWPHEATPA